MNDTLRKTSESAHQKNNTSQWNHISEELTTLPEPKGVRLLWRDDFWGRLHDKHLFYRLFCEFEFVNSTKLEIAIQNPTPPRSVAIH